ncbi:hypothetical protein AGDE_00123 [Angomonas deanei]|nr:hypothetical protein AGDE_00123 [Angomonas deanei]|eukprot:EPY43798.1 hypothetical protein AGDE_00123 [Angomonas deanei]
MSGDPVADVTTLSTAELNVHVARCDRLLGQEALLSRLPDKGEKFRVRREMYQKELARRQTEEQVPPTGKMENEQSKLAEEGVGHYREEAIKIGDKYKDRRVPVESTVRRMYEGVLSEQQIQKIIQEVPENFFLTRTETIEMEKENYNERRRLELARLREQMKSA